MTLSRTPLRANREHDPEKLHAGTVWAKVECNRCGDRQTLPKSELSDSGMRGYCNGLKRGSGLKRTLVNPYNAERRARSRAEDGERHTYGAYFRWAVGRRCCACGAYPCVPHHLDTVGGGGRDAENLLDTCYECHDQIETEGLSSWEEEYGIDAEDRARELWERYREEEG